MFAKIEPNDDKKARVSCRLHTFEFASAEAYRCLSYVWGVPEQQTILVNGEEMKVTKNLAGFLERIRARTLQPHAYYWIDALCINQSDQAEKDIHVAQMGHIYQGAQVVIAWLGWEWDRQGNGSSFETPEYLDRDGRHRDLELYGTEGGARHRGVQYLRELAIAFRRWKEDGGSAWPPSTELKGYAFNDVRMYEMLDVRPAPMATWASLAFLLAREWFQRAWVVQEASLAKVLVVVCGFQDIAWDDFVQVSIFLHASGWLLTLLRLIAGRGESMLPPGWQVILFATLQHVTKQAAVPKDLGDIFNKSFTGQFGKDLNAADLLEIIISKTMPFHATNPRDKLYSGRALVTAAFPVLQAAIPGVDYKGEVSSIYTEYAGYLLEHSAGLDLLSYAEDSSLRQLSAQAASPSWVPNFAETGHSVLRNIPGVNYTALSRPKNFSIWDRASGTLEVEGMPLDDMLEDFGPPLDALFTSKDLRPLWKFYLELPFSRKLTIEMLWRTLIGDCDGISCPAQAATAHGFKRYLQIVTAILHHGNTTNPSLTPVPSWSEWALFDDLRTAYDDAANAIPSVSELTDYAENWRRIMIDPSHLAEAKHIDGIGQSDMYALAVDRVRLYRRLFVSGTGRLGLAPLSARTGDQIWLLAGARVPFILRPAEGEGRFRVVGEAYVYGVMHGEAQSYGDGNVLQRIRLV